MHHHGIEEEDFMAAARGSGLQRSDQIKYDLIEWRD
jgi:hypothetical protein